jgi:hypothetical protein
MSMKNSNYTNKNRTRGLPACNAVPQPTAPPCTLVHDCNLSKKQNELLGSRLKGRIFTTKILKCVSFEIAKMNPKNFSLKETIRHFVMMFALL